MGLEACHRGLKKGRALTMHPENTKENTQFGAFLIKNTVYEEQMG